jgi:Uma2 family endonuclease
MAMVAEQRVVLEGISWELYEQLLAEIGERSHVRLTYDEGRLELMSAGVRHELVKKNLARLVQAYADERGILLEGFGSTTYRRKDLLKGLEPDECYYLQNAAKVIGRVEFDWAVDPPPDLAIEVAISRAEVAREPVYAALGVAEIWKCDGERVISLHRRADGEGPSREARYVEAEESLAFLGLPMGEVNRIVQVGLKEGQQAAVKGMREWCKHSLSHQ